MDTMAIYNKIDRADSLELLIVYADVYSLEIEGIPWLNKIYDKRLKELAGHQA